MIVSLSLVVLFFLLSLFCTRIIFLGLSPFLYGQKGLLFSTSLPTTLLSYVLESLLLPQLSKRQLLTVSTVLTLLTMAFLSIPVFLQDIDWSHSALYAFLFYLFSAKFVWVVLCNYKNKNFALFSKGENFISFAVNWFLCMSVISFVFTNSTNSEFISGGLFSKSILSIVYFLFLLATSKYFYLRSTDDNLPFYSQLVSHFSKILWFLFLSWIFIGPVFSSGPANFVLYLFVVVILISIYETVLCFMPQAGERLHGKIDDNLVLPMHFLISSLVLIEVLLW